MTTRFTDKVVLITGAGSGLGRAAALQLASEGASLSLIDVSEAGLADTAAQVTEIASGTKVLQLVADVSNESDVESYVQKTVEAFGRIDGFFNNAGIEGKQNLTEDFGSEEFDKVVSINLRGVFLGLKYVLAVMKDQGAGHVVNTASVGGIRGVGNQSGYAAAKHGVVGLTRNSGIEYGQYGITVTAIAPGAIMTPMVEGVTQADRPGQLGRGWPSVRQRESDAAVRTPRGGRPPRRVPAVRRRLVHQRHHHSDRRRTVREVLTPDTSRGSHHTVVGVVPERRIGQ
ncbi:SDR family NAD(P)-dependent oxidoreductase [Gordonia tangerina]|uniref:SDR family NAD(P)-dependent oxidoreductase n=1 Tax=Gordonia tangerina TaxID=2911060 RepID=UPI003EE10AAC